MPIYEYVCEDCQKKFDALRPMSKADAPIACKYCQGMRTTRQVSLFAAHSSSGPIAGASGGGCASCAGGTCSGCASH